ncbi:hypothetical protein COV04_03610 [Candidatus Uhrbacteria bacterium CG10_big_fil_rev_8_21_14_0_10_48_11]|uniref:Uncharacterized protein n=1 Tax=Candidatus Uhrbacteria bacterium CG10_big_fil_rev_8_21_14_0_10_48_11 TaxID=1975037 RepID=A0A2M8LDY0_9BACT|nr:MAG: hypothetical protein COV04_03610 [Candidatus Uhrbacteria bacterium CG10_big_fil_rev_8_21_14_0_10_48_11]
MALKQYATLMFIGTVLTWAAWILVVLFLDPLTAGWLGFSVFYLALYLALTGTFSLLGLLLRRLFFKNELVYRQVTISFRQAFSFSFLVIAALFLQSKQLLTWWNMFFLIAALTFLEFAVIAYQGRGRNV